MNTGRAQNLKKVLDAVPTGYLVDAKWLTAHGIAYESFRDYVNRGWLERVYRGVFRRPAPTADKNNTLDWETCVLSLQHIMGYDAHVGSMTALSRQSYDHYLRLGRTAPVWIYGDGDPPWLGKLPLSASMIQRKRTLFADPTLGVTSDESRSAGSLSRDWQLRISTPERAILEALDELPDHESFHNLDMVFEGLTTLRPRLLTALLQSCKKIKVIRLFFVFADRHDHPWRKRLDVDAFNLGKGDRALVKGGRIHPRYRIMVPKEFISAEVDDGT
ncbi:type IV toxin-antitoxin system AbiEi family antitoxin [uncultured Roseobacter sp.]|uniref:type IV toxin-antitoxin system AbiEi family antitoxin n=1 Tax=uncultured Roseobacter sp. TaxID=114847 RepID=UPI0026252466|nr:type IV toxin-antitoxin system AbiEi family antitoxin [uncultured Roseobacter sp.]